MDSVTLVIPGKPVPQPRPKVCRRGAFVSTYTPDNGIRAYRDAISLIVRAAMAGVMHTGAVRLTVELEFVRPPSHYSVTKKYGRRLKETAPAWPVDGDCSNYVKGVEDCLNGVAWKDDVQIVSLNVTKCYTERQLTIITIEGVPGAVEKSIAEG
jgi:Holliday junction resolvase RusA-like endonuclease